MWSRFLMVIVMIGMSVPSFAQVTISSTLFSTAFVNESEICRISLINSGESVTVFIRAELTNADLEKVLYIETQSFLLPAGFVNINPQDLSFSEVVYGISDQSNYIKTSQKLPSGFFQYCVEVVVQKDGVAGDNMCEEIHSEDNGFLFLVSPEDESVIETQFPMLIWMHSEPFSVLTSKDWFRLILVALDEEESAQSGITTKAPLFYVNKVWTHSVQYPADAPDLIPGNRYGWQVQRISNEFIIERTEAWSFTYLKPKLPVEKRYVKLKRSLDSGFYTVTDEKVFFRFDEKYHSSQIACVIKSFGAETQLANSENTIYQDEVNYKENGYNAFELDLEPLNLKPGFYILEVNNEKDQTFKLKLLIE